MPTPPLCRSDIAARVPPPGAFAGGGACQSDGRVLDVERPASDGSRAIGTRERDPVGRPPGLASAGSGTPPPVAGDAGDAFLALEGLARYAPGDARGPAAVVHRERLERAHPALFATCLERRARGGRETGATGSR